MRIHNLSPKEGSTKRHRRTGRGISAGQGASGGFGMRGQKISSSRCQGMKHLIQNLC